jgi:predicted nucleic acid-binding protein
MTLRALVDTNVMVDLLLTREPWFSQAKAMWDARDAGQLECSVPGSALTDLYYICRNPTVLGPAAAKLAIEMVLQRFEILTIDRTVLQSALLLPGLDFEDNVQIACAVANRVDVIVTRDPVDFRHSPITAIEPLGVSTYLTNP